MSCLSILQSVYTKVLSSKPTVATGSSDPKVLQCVEYLNEAGQELAARYSWQVLTNETVFDTVAAESQGTIQALTAPGFAYILNNVMWNRSQRRPVFGPRSDAEWQNLKATFIAGPWVQYRIRQNQLLFLPAPPAGQVVAFEWVTSYWASGVGGAGQSSFLQDSDVSLLDERVLGLDCLWRFKRAQKLAYDEDYNKAQAAIEDLMTRDATKQTLNMNGIATEVPFGTVVPAGNWGLA